MHDASARFACGFEGFLEGSGVVGLGVALGAEVGHQKGIRAGGEALRSQRQEEGDEKLWECRVGSEFHVHFE
jgi:hypothetical protein